MTIASMELANLRGLIKFASPLPWQWATSNSTARLSSASGKDGDVVSAFRATDGVPCVNVSSDNMNLIASAVNALPDLIAHIDAQAARIAEQLAVIDQRNGECDRLIKELAGLRKQKIQPAPVAVPDEIVRDDADGYWMYKGERVSATAKEWYNQALADVLRLNSGSKPQRFVVKRPGFFHTDQSTDLILGKQEKDWEEAVRAAGGEIAE